MILLSYEVMKRVKDNQENYNVTPKTLRFLKLKLKDFINIIYFYLKINKNK